MEQMVRGDVATVVPLRLEGGAPLGAEQLLEQGLRIVVGMVALASEAVIGAVGRTLGYEPPGSQPSDETAPVAYPVAGAALGVAVEVGRWGARAATTALRTTQLAASFATSPAFVRDRLSWLRSGLLALDRSWQRERPVDEDAAARFMRVLVPEIVDATLDQLDLNEIVGDRVELDRVVDGVDLDRAVARVDLDALVARIDLDQIVARLDVDRVAATLDLDRLVDRVDVDAVAARLDVEAVVRRLDLPALAREVIDELDLPELIRESMGSMTTETVGGIRVQSMQADRAVSRIVDRLLGRGEREVAANAEEPD